MKNLDKFFLTSVLSLFAFTTLAQPEIEVYQGVDNSGILLSTGQILPAHFGHVDQGTDNDITFVIENKGTSSLIITSITLADAIDFSFISEPNTVGSGATEIFVIRLSGATTGIFNDFVTINSNDTDEPAFEQCLFSME